MGGLSFQLVGIVVPFRNEIDYDVDSHGCHGTSTHCAWWRRAPCWDCLALTLVAFGSGAICELVLYM
eukprot:4893814-Amphidinium_carterae.1